MQLAYARHRHAGRRSARLHTHLHKDALQVLLHRHRAGTQDVADVRDA